jgi:alpha-tubulin suppressor-like RCC1 family protein
MDASMKEHTRTPAPTPCTHTHRITLTATLMLIGACELDPEAGHGPIHLSARQTEPYAVAAMSLGDDTTCVVTEAGAAKCWGRNDAGQLGQADAMAGDGETPVTISFIELEGLANDALTDGDRAFALMRDGSIRTWSADVSTVLQIGGSVARLVVGSGFACARLESGAVRCWGANDSGQLGLGHTDPIAANELSTEAQDVDLGGPALDITTGAHHACALLEGGAVRCWGANDFGQLGQGHTDDIGDDETPASTGDIELGGKAVGIVAGGLHTCALLESGAIRCWGDGQQGQLGHGRILIVGDGETPAALGDVPVGGAVVELTAGWQHTCALLETGVLRCWGDNAFGQLGYGTTDDVGDDETPAIAGDIDLGSQLPIAVFSGPSSQSTCVLLEGGAARCWGANEAGQLGQGHTLPLGDDPSERPGDLPNIIILDDDP